MEARRRRLMVTTLFLLVVTLILWTGGDTCSVQGAPSADVPDGVGEWLNSTAYIETNFGTIVVELADLGAPITVANFIGLADEHFYDNLKWHRIVDDFVIQTGDPNTKDNNPYNDGSGGSTTTIPLEINDSLTHEDGAIGMARSTDPDSASSQFYICDGAQNGLDQDYAVFGYVVEGMDIVRAIASVEVNGNRRPALSQQPVDDVWLYSVRVVHGLYNETGDLPDGPTEAVSEGASGVVTGGVMALVAVPIIIIPLTFLLLRREKRRGRGAGSD